MTRKPLTDDLICALTQSGDEISKDLNEEDYPYFDPTIISKPNQPLFHNACTYYREDPYQWAKRDYYTAREVHML